MKKVTEQSIRKAVENFVKYEVTTRMNNKEKETYNYDALCNYFAKQIEKKLYDEKLKLFDIFSLLAPIQKKN